MDASRLIAEIYRFRSKELQQMLEPAEESGLLITRTMQMHSSETQLLLWEGATSASFVQEF